MKKPNYDYVKNLDAMHSEDQVLLFEHSYLSFVEGKVLTLLEGLLENMNDQKHSAIKSLVNDAFWGDMHNGWATPVDKEKFESLTL